MRSFFEKKYNVYDIVYCKNPEVAKEISDNFRIKGYSVAVSNVEITTGTYGSQNVKKLDILTEFTEAEYEEDEQREQLFRDEIDAMVLAKKEKESKGEEI